jgi:MFS family permease
VLASVPPVAKTIVSEIPTDKDMKAYAMSYLSLNINLGKVFANFLGGFLAHPEGIGIHWFTDYPYLLPNAAIAVSALVSALLIAITYRETLYDHATGEPTEQASYSELVKQPDLRLMVLNFSMLTINVTCISKLQVLWFYSEKSDGGLELDSH